MDNNFENSNKENKNTLENKIKKGVDFVFEQNPELFKIGTKELYSNYLENVFPKSKIREIVYRSDENEERILSPKYLVNGENIGTYFGTLDEASFHLRAYDNRKVFASLINIVNPNTDYDSSQKIYYYSEKDINKIKEAGYDGIFTVQWQSKKPFEYVVFENSQIHILGSEKDIEDFKNFIS